MGTTQALLVETGDKRDGRGYRIATLGRRAELVAEYRRSGLTMAAFARRESLAYSTVAGWVWKSDRARGGGRAARRGQALWFVVLRFHTLSKSGRMGHALPFTLYESRSHG